MQHLVDIQDITLPEQNSITELNWTARLILSELQNWCGKRSEEESFFLMQTMLQSFNIERENAEKTEYEVLNYMFE